MAQQKYALSWYRPREWADLLGKPEGRAVSNYPASTYTEVMDTAIHINELNPEFDCNVEVFIQ